MKISEAMKKGIRASKPVKGMYVTQIGGELCACAAGAAAIGLVGEVKAQFEPYDIIRDYWPVTLMKAVKHPLRPEGWRWSLIDVITDLNDNRDWSRKEIADWLEKQGL
jgi:hypothetical protein